jgi:hypothetical protein
VVLEAEETLAVELELVIGVEELTEACEVDVVCTMEVAESLVVMVCWEL